MASSCQTKKERKETSERDRAYGTAHHQRLSLARACVTMGSPALHARTIAWCVAKGVGVGEGERNPPALSPVRRSKH